MAVGARGRVLLRGGVGSVVLDADGPTMINPGSVGQPRSADPRARVAVLDLARGEAHFHAVPWDVAGNRASLVELGRPPHANWRRVPAWRRAARRVRRVIGEHARR
jgi:hypothetical protein